MWFMKIKELQTRNDAENNFKPVPPEVAVLCSVHMAQNNGSI